MNKKIRCICETGIFISLSVVLRFIFKLIPLFDMPNGGSVSLLMLPIMLNGYRNGYKYGLIGGITYAIIDFMLDGFFWHIGSIFFDYLFAFGALGLTGLLKEKAKDIKYYILGMILVCFIRYLFHGLSGVIFFKDATSSLSVAIIYSFITYNGPYMLLSTILCIVVAIPLHKIIYKEN